MRERLTAAFVLLAIVVLTVAGLARLSAVRDVLNEHASESLAQDARTVAVLLGNRELRGERVDEEILADLVGEQSRLEYARGDTVLAVEGSDYAAEEDELVGRATEGPVSVEVRRSAEGLREAVGRERASLVVLLLTLVLLSGAMGYVAARALSAPFRMLAEAASALGRGRFDPELPRSSIPEVVAISRALKVSAAQIEQSVVRDREFVRHASHVLRTPLTSLRLELEDLAGRPDVIADVRDTAAATVVELVKIDEVINGLARFALERELVAGADSTVQAVATAIGERWRGALAEAIEVRVHVDLGPEQRLTPGPVEQVTDQLLLHVVASSARSVSLRFAGQGRFVRVGLQASVPMGTTGDNEALERAARLADSMGGRLRGELTTETGLNVLLPRR